MTETTQNTKRDWEEELVSVVKNALHYRMQGISWAISDELPPAYWDIKDFIKHIEDKAYVKGYEAANGKAGTEAGILWVNREEELSSAVQKEREYLTHAINVLSYTGAFGEQELRTEQVLKLLIPQPKESEDVE